MLSYTFGCVYGIYLSTLCGNGLSVYAMQVAKAPDGNGGVYAGIILVLIV